jgi:hypothetical protein
LQPKKPLFNRGGVCMEIFFWRKRKDLTTKRKDLTTKDMDEHGWDSQRNSLFVPVRFIYSFLPIHLSPQNLPSPENRSTKPAPTQSGWGESCTGNQAGYSTWAGCRVGRGGSLNFSQAGTTATKETMAVMRKGRRGLKRSHNCAPTQGAGREMKPRLL